MTPSADLPLLAAMRARLAWNALRGIRSHSILKITVIIIMAAGIWAGLFFAFYDGFRYMNRELFYGFKEVVVGLVLGLFFFALLVMLLFSNAIIAYGSLFRSEETAYLTACPFESWHVYAYKLAETLIFSSWAFLFLGLPLIVAYGLSEGAPIWFYPASALFFGVFAIIPASCGGIATLLIGRYLSGNPRRALIVVICLALLVAAIWSLGLVQAFRAGAQARGEVWIQTVVERLQFGENPLLPSTWASLGFRHLAAGRFVAAVHQFWLLLTNALFLGMIALLLARRLYRRAYHHIQEHTSRRGAVRERGFYLALEHGLIGITTPMRLLIIKDLKMFVRDPVQWSQVLLFFGLLAVYFANLRNFRYNILSQFWNNFISLMNLVATSLTLSTFTCRFIFPLISLEGRRFWVLGLLPVGRRQLMYSKFWFAFVGSFFISELLIVISDLMLRAELTAILLHAVTVLMLCSGLSALAVGLGAVYPNLREDNPSKIVSGFGGTLNLVLSMVYVMIVLATAVAPYHISRMGPKGGQGAILQALGPGGIVLAAGLAMAATWLPIWVGEHALDRMET